MNLVRACEGICEIVVARPSWTPRGGEAMRWRCHGGVQPEGRILGRGISRPRRTRVGNVVLSTTLCGALRGAVCGLRPAACRSRPATCGLQPAACNLRPATCGLRHAACNLQPVACPATCGMQPAACNLQPAPCSLQPAACRLQPAACSATCGREEPAFHPNFRCYNIVFGTGCSSSLNRNIS